MSEHTATVPQFLQCQGCKEANRSLIAGKLDWYSYSSLRNTANSITPVGEINLRRAKTMPRRETVIATMAHPSKTAARSTLARPNRRRSAGTLHSALKIFTVLLGVILLLQLIGPPILDQVVSSPSGLRFLSGSRENSVSTEWDLVIIKFLSTVRPIHFRTDKIESAFKENSSSPFVLLTLNSGVPSINVDNLHPMYKRHGRCSSVEYIIRNITSNPDFPPLNLTALIDVSDGEAPTVATFSSARHWHSWKDVIPMPLGNRNGWRAGKATPIESWDTYINENVVKTHANFPWSTKENKAVFRGSLRMCDHVLGSCNWENGARCQNSERWDECNRGVLYKRVWRIRQYFDVAFTRWVLRPDRNFHQVDGAPAAVEEIPFADFQKYKLILNVGAINGMFSTHLLPILQAVVSENEHQTSCMLTNEL